MRTLFAFFCMSGRIYALSITLLYGAFGGSLRCYLQMLFAQPSMHFMKRRGVVWEELVVISHVLCRAVAKIARTMLNMLGRDFTCSLSW